MFSGTSKRTNCTTAAGLCKQAYAPELFLLRSFERPLNAELTAKLDKRHPETTRVIRFRAPPSGNFLNINIVSARLLRKLSASYCVIVPQLKQITAVKKYNALCDTLRRVLCYLSVCYFLIFTYYNFLNIWSSFSLIMISSFKTHYIREENMRICFSLML